jgi:DNA-binding transcriptional MerR regulator/methylmalonyl-CoA mutase cobalamin-binding subunit
MSEREGRQPRYPVRHVIDRTGLSADVLRAWERRYGAVRPQRSPGGQRLYSEEDVARLELLKRATIAGHSIAEVARLDLPALESLVGARGRGGPVAAGSATDSVVATAMAAVERLDAGAIEAALKRAALRLGGAAVVDEIVSRFLHDIGERWHAGDISPAHEHLASAAVRRVLGWTADAYVAGPRAPRLVVATPAGELHEFGALLAGSAASDEGWRVVYLGASLPAPDIVAVAEQVGARAVALSAIHDADGSAPRELLEAARLMPHDTTMFAGGPVAGKHEAALRDAGARVLPDIRALRDALRVLRASGRVETAVERTPPAP